MPGIGLNELLVILVILLLLFGSSKLPELARSMGKAKKEFKKGMDEEQEVPEEAEGAKAKKAAKPKAKEAPTEEEEKPVTAE